MCEYCQGEVDDRKSLLKDECDGCDLPYEVYIGGNQLHTEYDYITIKCCPMCGRELTEDD